MTRTRLLASLASTIGLAIVCVAGSALGADVIAQPATTRRVTPPQPPPGPQPTRPPLLFSEAWRLPQHDGPPTNENRRVTPAVVTHPRVALAIYGEDAAAVIAWEHDGRVDLWTGMARSPIAMTVKDREHYLDLRELARVRWIVRTEALHVLYPVVKLADGTLLAGNRGVTTDGDFLQVEVAFAGHGAMRWYRLDPVTVVTTTEVRQPDLSRVDEVGFVDLAPGGGHGRAGWSNLSSVEVYATASPRERPRPAASTIGDDPARTARRRP